MTERSEGLRILRAPVAYPTSPDHGGAVVSAGTSAIELSEPLLDADPAHSMEFSFVRLIWCYVGDLGQSAGLIAIEVKGRRQLATATGRPSRLTHPCLFRP